MLQCEKKCYFLWRIKRDVLMNSYTVGKHCDTLFILKYQYQARRVMMRVCLCDLCIDIVSGSTISLFDFGPVPTVELFFFLISANRDTPPKKISTTPTKNKSKTKNQNKTCLLNWLW